MNRATPVLCAVKEAIARAGFVNVRGEIFREESCKAYALIFMASCPCGLGVSGFQYMVSDRAPQIELDYLPERAYRDAMAHIEHDKAEGRWK